MAPETKRGTIRRNPRGWLQHTSLSPQTCTKRGQLKPTHVHAIRLLLVASVSALFLPIAAMAKPATCTIKQNGAIQFSGRCDVQPFGGDGSFSIVNSEGGVLIPGVTQVSVALLRGMAEVRGLTVDGIHSR